MVETRELRVVGMDCADCARTLERGVGTLNGVASCEVNFAAELLTVQFDAATTDPAAIAKRVKSLGYGVAGDEPSAPPVDAPVRGPIASFFAFMRGRGNPALWTSAVLLLVSLGLLIVPVVEGLATWIGGVALLIGGFPIARRGVRSLIFSRRVTIDLLVAIAGIGAIILGETVEGAILVVLFSLGEALEGFAINRSREAMRSLQRLAPAEATLLERCEDCEEHLGKDGYSGGPCPFCVHERTVAVADVTVGTLILVRAGERIPLDGTIVRGNSGVNQQALTGESMPLDRGPDDPVYAGSVNGDGTLEILVTAPASGSLVSRIASLVERAFNNRAPVERVVDKFASIYTPAVIVIAVLVASVPPLLFGQPFWNVGEETGWLYRALTLLVVACPCALVISTPATVVSALAAAARAGALIKGGAALEALTNVRVVAFDKTGTLTTGEPHVTSVTCADNCCDAGTDCEHCDELLNLAASVEMRSAHPLAGAITAAADSRKSLIRYAAADNVTALPGRGVQGMVGDRLVTIGSHTYFDADHSHDPRICDWVDAAEAHGQTVMLVCDCDTHDVRGFIAVADQPRTISRTAISSLKDAGIHVVMLTGDNAAAGQAIGTAVGVDEVRAGLLPDQKLDAIHDLNARFGDVAMVGDGINDTPALAAATVGVAMGAAGSAQALQTADVALMGDDLRRLPFMIKLARQARSIIWQNITFSIVSKLIFVGLVIGGFSSLWMAVLADVGASLIVTLNGMRLLRATPEATEE